MSLEFGPYVRELRKARGIPLRRFADGIGMDPSNYSRIERGEAPPPQESTVLATIAEQLGVEAWRDPVWYELVSRAALSRGRVPDAVLQDEEVARLLPAFFARVQRARREHPATLSELYATFREVIEETQTRSAATPDERSDPSRNRHDGTPHDAPPPSRPTR